MRDLITLVCEYSNSKRIKCKQDCCLIRSSFQSFQQMLKIISTGRIFGKRNFIRHNHQRRLKEADLKLFSINILRRMNKIRRIKSFDELYDIISSCSVKGIGELTVYDIAFRIGSYLGKYPKKVYMHAATREGARALRCNVSRKYIYKKEFPEPMQVLKPYEIEDFLCKYKDELRRR